MKHVLLICCLLTGFQLSAQTSADVTFQISALTTLAPPSIQLKWHSVLNVTGYNVHRKLRNEVNWTALANNLPASDTFYTDNTVAPGIGYEYRVTNAGMTVTGYVYASLSLPATHHMGKIIVVVDSTYLQPLANEIKTFEMDLIKEGWTVARINAGRNQSVSSVKQAIRNIYMSAPGWVKGIALIGHVPVPYSGSLNPDGHPDHSGAWPADLYYCDTLTNYWTDLSINNVAASRPENINIPGDGKFDQTTVLQPLMFIGRADVYNMPAFSSNDTMLMQRYLLKDHEYRTEMKTYRMRALIDDNFGYFGGEAFAQNGFRNYAALLSADSVMNGDYFTDMKNNSYLWSYGCGGGWYQGAGGVGNSANFQTDTIQSVFTLLFGSYFGDWDNQDNFLRAPLASPSPTLTNFWAGRPNIFMHHMGLGEPIGNTFMETVKNNTTYHPFGYGSKFVHEALMGDPTLKMYPYKGAFGLASSAVNGGSIASLTWLDSPDPQVLGYYVYRSTALTDSFKLLNVNYTVNTSYHDSTAAQGKNIYMVRAVKLQKTNTGYFYNLSPGIIDSVNISTPFAVNDVKAANIQLNIFPNPAADYVQVESPDAVITVFEVNDVSGNTVYRADYPAMKYTVNTSQWSAGTYLVKIATANGTALKKFMVSHTKQ
jgi:hypothetical protein